MEKVNVVIELFTFEELSESTKVVALWEHRGFMLEKYNDSDFDESINMTYEEYEESLTDNEVIENIEANDYYFFENGELADVVQRAGEKVLTYNGKEYKI